MVGLIRANIHEAEPDDVSSFHMFLALLDMRDIAQTYGDADAKDFVPPITVQEFTDRLVSTYKRLHNEFQRLSGGRRASGRKTVFKDWKDIEKLTKVEEPPAEPSKST